MLQFAILRAAAFLVPRQERTEWVAEWKSELWYVLAACPGEATAFCLGAFRDAFWLRCTRAAVNSPRTSPLRCLMLLAVLAGAGVLLAMHMSGEIRIFPHALIVFVALVVLPVATPLDFGEYPVNSHPVSWRGKRWMFFATKVVFLLSSVFCGSLFLGSIGLAPIQGQALLVGYVFAFRWALLDQRRRCPVCLHVLTNPVRIGQSSRTLLAWYGTELICAKGHGVLQVPEIATSCYRTQRWLDLDPT